MSPPETAPVLPAQRWSKAAVTGLVLAIVGFVLFPLNAIGAALGIAGLVKTGRVPSLRGRGVATAALVIGSLGVILSVALVPAIAIPSFIRYMRKAKTAEAVDRTAYLFRAVRAYADGERVGPDGRVATGWLPPSAPRTPAVPPARSKVIDSPGAWDHPAWRALDFAIADPHYFAYEVQVAPDGKSFAIRAVGDLDGDGRYSTFERAGRVENGRVVPAGELRATDEFE